MEFNILYYLALHPGWTFTREQLYRYAMPDDFASGLESVTSRIYKIRKKLNINAIQTVYGYGYRYTFVANMYPSTDYADPSGIYSTDPQVAKALATMSDEEAKELIGGLYNTDDPAVVQEIYTAALDSANESSVVIPLNYRNEYAVFNNEVIESYTFNSIPNHVDVAAIHLK